MHTDNDRLYSQRLSVPAGEERLVTVKSPALPGGLHRVRASLAGEERFGWISAKERSKLLLLSGDEDDRRVLKQLFAHRGYAVEDIVMDGSARVPDDLSKFRGVVLNNAARRQVPGGFLEKLEQYARQGGGVLLIGGDFSSGSVITFGTPLEEMSPVKPSHRKPQSVASIPPWCC